MTQTQVPAPPLAGRLARVRERIDAACARAGRDPAGVTLIAVSKTFGADDIAAAWHAGVRDFGENRVQEALPKIETVRSLLPASGAPRFHLVGHLQTNKARAAAEAFAILHGVDSTRAIEALARAGSHRVRVMLEVNVAAEPAKFGISPSGLAGLLEAAQCRGVAVEGLMTVAPLALEAEDARPVFRELRGLAERHGLPALSMGMSADFDVAIEEGATHVRIGRAIFGERTR